VAAHAGKAGIHAMPAPTDAFAARVLLANAAEISLDVQYYIWNGDQTERPPAGEVVYDAEPETSAGRRSWIRFLECMPIEWLL